MQLRRDDPQGQQGHGSGGGGDSGEHAVQEGPVLSAARVALLCPSSGHGPCTDQTLCQRRCAPFSSVPTRCCCSASTGGSRAATPSSRSRPTPTRCGASAPSAACRASTLWTSRNG